MQDAPHRITLGCISIKGDPSGEVLMGKTRLRIRFWVAAVALSVLSLHAEDLRENFGTRSMSAAKLINQAIQLSESGKHAEALKAIDKAIQEDPSCPMAYYRKAIVLYDLSRIDEAVEQYKMVLAKGT